MLYFAFDKVIRYRFLGYSRYRTRLREQNAVVLSAPELNYTLMTAKISTFLSYQIRPSKRM